MSLGNDLYSAYPEPEAYDCRYCERKTYDARRICPDCRHEGVYEIGPT